MQSLVPPMPTPATRFDRAFDQGAARRLAEHRTRLAALDARCLIDIASCRLTERRSHQLTNLTFSPGPELTFCTRNALVGADAVTSLTWRAWVIATPTSITLAKRLATGPVTTITFSLCDIRVQRLPG